MILLAQTHNSTTIFLHHQEAQTSHVSNISSSQISQDKIWYYSPLFWTGLAWYTKGSRSIEHNIYLMQLKERCITMQLLAPAFKIRKGNAQEGLIWQSQWKKRAWKWDLGPKFATKRALELFQGPTEVTFHHISFTQTTNNYVGKLNTFPKGRINVFSLGVSRYKLVIYHPLWKYDKKFPPYLKRRHDHWFSKP